MNIGRITSIALPLLIFIGFAFTQDKKKTTSKTKNSYKKKTVVTSEDAQFEIFNIVYNNLKNSYVDSIDQSKVILAGVDGMLNALDPYTKILRGASKERYEMLAKGKYGGVGMQIDEVRDTIIITKVYEDSPSYSEGLMAGDMILGVDSTNVVKLGKKATIKLLKGEVDSPVSLTIFRRPGAKRKVFKLLRGNISINNIPYWGLDEDNIGYIKINKFSKFTSDYFKEALESMVSDGMESLIIDLRSNGGGLLRESTNILDFLLERDVENPMLVRKGRGTVRNYYSKNDPVLDASIPIIIMQNKSSASASEIITGVMQDLDRAVILGQNSFGKGLVQITKTINDTLKLKVTTAKYYLPSGRLIQKYDYLGDGSLTDGLNEKDSTFFSSNGRKISGGGGITPDIKTTKDPMPNFVKSLWLNERLFVLFGTEYSTLITDKAFSLYKLYLNDKYGQDYLNLGEKFAIDILDSKSELSYIDKLIMDKEKKIELSLNIEFIKQANKLYKQLTQHSIFQNLSNKNYDEIIEYSIDVKRYIHASGADERPSVLLKNYLTDKNLFFYKGSTSNKKIGKYELFSILSRMLGIITELDVSKLDDYKLYLYDIDYSNIDSYRDTILEQHRTLIEKMEVQNQVVDWYIKLFSGKVTSPHFNIGFNEIDKNFINSRFNLNKEKRKLISEFRQYVDSYEFNYLIEGEREFNDLKKELENLPEFSSKETDKKEIFIHDYLKNRRFNKLINRIEDYMNKNKQKYFFLEKNMDWIVNGIFREYSKLAMDNKASVRTSLYLDSEYKEAIRYIKDDETLSRLLTYSHQELN